MCAAETFEGVLNGTHNIEPAKLTPISSRVIYSLVRYIRQNRDYFRAGLRGELE